MLLESYFISLASIFTPSILNETLLITIGRDCITVSGQITAIQTVSDFVDISSVRFTLKSQVLSGSISLFCRTAFVPDSPSRLTSCRLTVSESSRSHGTVRRYTLARLSFS